MNRKADSLLNLFILAIMLIAFCFFLIQFYQDEADWQHNYEKSYEELEGKTNVKTN